MMPTWNAKYFPKLFLGPDCNLGRGCPWAGSKRPRCPSPRSSQSGIAGCRSPRPACPVWHDDMINCPSKFRSSTGISRYIALHQGHHVLPCQNFGGQKVICIITQARIEQSFRLKVNVSTLIGVKWSQSVSDPVHWWLTLSRVLASQTTTAQQHFSFLFSFETKPPFPSS